MHWRKNQEVGVPHPRFGSDFFLRNRFTLFHWVVAWGVAGLCALEGPGGLPSRRALAVECWDCPTGWLPTPWPDLIRAILGLWPQNHRAISADQWTQKNKQTLPL